MGMAEQCAEGTTGVVYVHSSPSAVCPHVEWALSGALNARAGLQWSEQPAMAGQMRATCSWSGPVGTGAQLARALRSWPMLRFEVTEEASYGVDGERFSHVPGLGLWRASTSANGDVVIGEQRLRAMMATGRDSERLAAELDSALGAAWDDALEPYRCSGEGTEVTWLHRSVG
ncbi:MAG: DUF3145 domain-containing protein [Mycobacteriaceae bacterium]